MHQVKKIKIKSFKRLHEIEIEMRPLMVMIGPNGVGKTSLLEAISLLSSSAAGKMKSTLNDMGGVSNIITQVQSDKEISLTATMDVVRHKPLEYNLCIEPSGQTYKISSESLMQTRGQHTDPFKHIDSSHGFVHYFDTETNKLVKPNWEYDCFETALSQVPKMFKEPEELRRVLSSVIQYHALDVSSRAPIKLPQQMKPADFPGANGEDLVSFLYSLRESYHDCYEVIEDTLRAAFPWFESLNFPPVAAGTLSLTWKEKHFDRALYTNQLSEGILRFLWLISLLQSPGLSMVTMIDEPEVSLHPELLSLLAKLMREASEKTQIIVATHSDRLIRFLEPKEVLIMDVDEKGFASAKWADTLDLKGWLKDYSLDEIWGMGRLTG